MIDTLDLLRQRELLVQRMERDRWHVTDIDHEICRRRQQDPSITEDVTPDMLRVGDCVQVEGFRVIARIEYLGVLGGYVATFTGRKPRQWHWKTETEVRRVVGLHFPDTPSPAKRPPKREL